MKRPRARAGLTPISSRVRIAEVALEVGVGGGDPCSIGGGGAGGDDGIVLMEAVSGPLAEVRGRGTTPTPPAIAPPAVADAAPGPGGPVRRCGSLAICAS